MKSLRDPLAHSWRKEGGGRAYCCSVCGMRCYEPKGVTLECATFAAETKNRRAHRGYHTKNRGGGGG